MHEDLFSHAEEAKNSGMAATVERSQPLDMLKKIVEALLFAASEPLSFDKLKATIEEHYPVQNRQLRQVLSALAEEYSSQGRAFGLEEIARGFVLRSRPLFAPFIDSLYRNKRSEKLSPAAMEVVAIIAYRQPITRPQIDSLRGVDSSGTLHALLERGLIATRGRMEAPGKPPLYVTTAQFLRHFGLKDPSELPPLTA